MGLITRAAGTRIAGDTGDNGPAIEAEINRPAGVAVTAMASSCSPTAATTSSAGFHRMV
jgi:hypothetical protein